MDECDRNQSSLSEPVVPLTSGSPTRHAVAGETMAGNSAASLEWFPSSDISELCDGILGTELPMLQGDLWDLSLLGLTHQDALGVPETSISSVGSGMTSVPTACGTTNNYDGSIKVEPNKTQSQIEAAFWARLDKSACSIDSSEFNSEVCLPIPLCGCKISACAN